MLQCVAVWCSVVEGEVHDVALDAIGGVQLLQYVAMCCSVLQCVAA